MIPVCFWFSMRIHSSLILDVDSLEGRKSTSFSQMLHVPFHLQLGNNSMGARLAGVANPLHPDCAPGRNEAQPPCPAAENLEMTAAFAQAITWAIITFSVNSPTFRSRVGGAWEHLREGGTTSLIIKISCQETVYGYSVIALWFAIFQIQNKRKPQTETVPHSTSSDGRNRFSTPADFTPKPTAV